MKMPCSLKANQSVPRVALVARRGPGRPADAHRLIPQPGVGNREKTLAGSKISASVRAVRSP